MSIDHIGIVVSDYRRSLEFYRSAFKPLGLGLVAEVDRWAGFGSGELASFWFGEDPGIEIVCPIHIAFTAANERQVQKFYDAAIAAGGNDNGAPGLREHYHRGYYGAFVLDPDGHNVEAVFHGSGESNDMD